MIEAITGRIGGGKTCLAVIRICEYIASGGRVYTNVRLRGTRDVFTEDGKDYETHVEPDAPVAVYLRKKFDWEIQHGQYNYLYESALETGFEHCIPKGLPEKKVLVVLDEVNEWFDTLDREDIKKASGIVRDTFRFLRQSRKCYIDVIFILQVFETLNNRIRDLVLFLWVCRDMQYFKVSGVPLGWMFKHMFYWQKFDRSLPRAPAQFAKWVKKDFGVFGLYDTTEFFGKDLGVLDAEKQVKFEKKVIDEGGDEMKRKHVLMLVGCCVSSLVGCVFAVLAVVRGEGAVVGKQKVIYVTNTVAVAQSPSSAVAMSSNASQRITWAVINYGCAGSVEWAYVEGRLYRPQMRVDGGTVVALDKDYIKVIGDDGLDYYIYNFRNEFAPSSVKSGGSNGQRVSM